MLAADDEQRMVISGTEGKDATKVGHLAGFLTTPGGHPGAIESCDIDIPKAFIKGVGDHLPNAQITFGKFQVIAQASRAVDLTRQAEQKCTPDLKGMRWRLLRDPGDLKAEARSELNALLAQCTSLRTARAWLYRVEFLQREQVHVVRQMLTQWCTNVMRSKVEPMKAVALMIRSHIDGIFAWVNSRQPNGFPQALNGPFQAPKRKARGYTGLITARIVIFLLVGKLDFQTINPHARA